MHLLRKKRINQKRKAIRERLHKIITDFQTETWELFCRNGDYFTRSDLNDHET